MGREARMWIDNLRESDIERSSGDLWSVGGRQQDAYVLTLYHIHTLKQWTTVYTYRPRRIFFLSHTQWFPNKPPASMFSPLFSTGKSDPDYPPSASPLLTEHLFLHLLHPARENPKHTSLHGEGRGAALLRTRTVGLISFVCFGEFSMTANYRLSWT